MGIEGAAIGTMISRFLALIFMIIYLFLDSKFLPYLSNLSIKDLDKFLFKKIFKIGFPSAAIMFFEISFFTCCVWMSGLLGKNSQAANQIALNLSTLTYMVAMGFSVVAMSRVGNQKGKQNFTELRRVAISVFLLIFLFFPESRKLLTHQVLLSFQGLGYLLQLNNSFQLLLHSGSLN